MPYSAASGKDIRRKKIILLNIHNFKNILSSEVLNYEIILSLRNPISSIGSSISHWLAYSKKMLTCGGYTSKLIEDCMKLKKKIYIVRLDLLHTKNYLMMRKILKIMNIKYHSNIKKSTHHGKFWWGGRSPA